MSLLKRKDRPSARRLAKRLIPELPAFLRLLFGLFRDGRVPFADKALVIGVILYIVSPIDLIPDIFGVLGFTDDLFLLGLSLQRLVSNAGDDVIRSHWSGTRETLRELVGGLPDLGSLLPSSVRGALRSWTGRD